MLDLVSVPAWRCHTVASLLLMDDQVLLIQHKKLNLWLAPGGHVEPGELPFQAAEREFFEETGVKVKAIEWRRTNQHYPKLKTSQSIPNPITTNLHWVSEENYRARLKSADPKALHITQIWPRGCEQHYCELFLVEPVQPGEIKLRLNQNEGTDLRWFPISATETKKLLSHDIYQEVKYLCHIHSTSLIN